MKQQKGETGDRLAKVEKTLAEGDYYQVLIFIRELVNKIEQLVLHLNNKTLRLIHTKHLNLPAP